MKKLFYHGTIYTMNKNCPVCEAIGTENGRITFTGTLEDGLLLAGPDTKKVDLEGRVVLPGFVEGHIHAPGDAYNQLFNVNLYDANSLEQTMDKIRVFVKEHPEKKIYYGRGFNTAFFPGLEGVLGPRKERLDEICRDKPIILTDFGGHTLWLNSKALEMNHITRESLPPSGGVIEKNAATGEVWGTLKEYAKQMVPYQQFSVEENMQAIEWFQARMHALGYTSLFCLRPPGAIIPRETLFTPLSQLEKEGRLKMRVNGARDMDPATPIEPQLEELSELKKTYESELIKVRTAKFFADGVIEGVTGCLMDPYKEAAGKDPQFHGEFIWDRDKMQDAFQKTMEQSFQIHIHTIGDRATKYCLDAIEAASPNERCRASRNVFTHLQLVRKEDVKRMSQLGIIANVQAYWHYKAPSMWENAELPFLGERAEYEYPLRTFQKHGVTLSASSDHPVTPVPNPFHAIQAGVTRNLYNSRGHGLAPLADMDDPRWLLNPSERVSVFDMLKAYTLGGAYQLFGEQEIGSIETGKYADFVIVDKDPFCQPALELENIRICETVFHGEVVYCLDH